MTGLGPGAVGNLLSNLTKRSFNRDPNKGRKGNFLISRIDLERLLLPSSSLTDSWIFGKINSQMGKKGCALVRRGDEEYVVIELTILKQYRRLPERIIKEYIGEEEGSKKGKKRIGKGKRD